MMDYVLYLLGWLVKGVLLALLVGAALNKLDQVIERQLQRRRNKRVQTQYEPTLKALIEKAHREADAVHKVRR